MPTYDYVCTVCGHEIEVVHSLHGHGPSGCPKCGGAVKKSYAPPTIHFKGSGWARKETGRDSGKAKSPTGSGEAVVTSEEKPAVARGHTSGDGH